MNTKEKGNRFERSIASILGKWMVNDKNAFIRSATSGGIKNKTYNGDIVPGKLISWNKFPFLIECKNGYKQHFPTLLNQNIIRKWISKLETEITSEQNIIFLIIRFHNQKGKVLITNKEINFFSPLIINTEENKKYYIYNFDILIQRNFNEIFTI